MEFYDISYREKNNYLVTTYYLQKFRVSAFRMSKVYDYQFQKLDKKLESNIILKFFDLINTIQYNTVFNCYKYNRFSVEIYYTV